jgi:ethanolamine utilization protein EutA
MSDSVQLIGLDFGTTTSSAVVASARLMRSAATGRVEICQINESYRSEMVFTPLDEHDRIDESKVEEYLDSWLTAGEVRAEDVFGGGALLTGLTAQKENASALVHLIRRRLGDTLVATADDPCLESWLAFMGNCAGLSRSLPRQPILNLDIGGGTTNLALGINGEVVGTGCLFIGARHVRVAPGTYRIMGISRYAEALFDFLGISKGKGDSLTNGEIQAILDFYLKLLEAAASGAVDGFQDPAAEAHVQVPLRRPVSIGDVAVTFSGGVGELIYRHAQGREWPPTTQFGDLGIDLAQRIASDAAWSKHVRQCRPCSGGRATVYGLLRHSTEVSGSTLFLPRPEVLPLCDVPILGSLNAASTAQRVRDVFDLVRRSGRGGCVQVRLGTHDAAPVRVLGERMASVLRDMAFPKDRPLVLLVEENLGKVLGQYVTQWGAMPLNLIVIDEVSNRRAQFVRIGAPRSQVVPVSFYGL